MGVAAGDESWRLSSWASGWRGRLVETVLAVGLLGWELLLLARWRAWARWTAAWRLVRAGGGSWGDADMGGMESEWRWWRGAERRSK